MTPAKQSYQTAIVALRDSQWEEATLHLLTLFAESPEYRDVAPVLIRLEQIRPVEYWCAAFGFAATQQDWAEASAALKILAQIAPDHPHLDEMRQRLPAPSSAAPPEESVGGQGVMSLTERISAAMTQESTVENRDLKHWLEVSALDDSAPAPLGTAELAELTAAVAADDAPDTDPLSPEMSSDGAGILEDEPASTAADTILSSGRSSDEGTGAWSEPPVLEQTKSRSITIHEAEGKKKRGWPDAVLLFLEVSALLAIIVIVVLMSVGGGGSPVASTDRYGGSVQAATDTFPLTMPDLISAVEQQLVRINEPQVALEYLHELDGLVGELAGADEPLTTAVTAWIAAGTVELEAAAAMNDTCAESGVSSAACIASIEAHAVSSRDTIAVRALVCDLMACPAN